MRLHVDVTTPEGVVEFEVLAPDDDSVFVSQRGVLQVQDLVRRTSSMFAPGAWLRVDTEVLEYY